MLLRAVIAAIIVVIVTEISDKYSRLGALLLTLPIVSIISFVSVWQKTHDMDVVNHLSRETLVLVPLGLPFFIPLAFSRQLGLSFGGAFLAGVILASGAIGLWFWLGPEL